MPQQLAYTPSEVSITWNECNDTYGWYRTIQSMNSAGGRCHDNAHCEARITRVKKDLLYSRYDTKKITIEKLKTLIWRYFITFGTPKGLAQQMVVCFLWSKNYIMTQQNRQLKKFHKEKV